MTKNSADSYVVRPAPYMNIQPLENFYKAPEKQHAYDMYDLYAANTEVETIDPGKSAIIPLGFKARIYPNTYTALMYPRSGNAAKYQVNLTNCVGVIEPSYANEWCALVQNNGQDSFNVVRGSRIAQFRLIKRVEFPIFVVDTIDYGGEDRDGLGSTGA